MTTASAADNHWCWSEALAIERGHSVGVVAFVVEWARALALAGDTAGINRMEPIADRLDQLKRDGGTG